MNLLLLVISFILTGFSMISMRALGAWGLRDYTGLYMVGFYGVGMLFSLVSLAVRRQRLGRREVLIGLAMGVCGVGAILSLLAALRSVGGVVAFPVRGAANIVLTAGISCFVWKEDLSPLQWLGIACGAAAVALLV